jgi:GxxExxY protein
MPISTRRTFRRWSQQEFGDVAFEVMRHVFEIHNELGRFFDERIYKREIAHRMRDVHLEEPIDVTFGSFHKRLFMDVLVGDGGLFEFKAVDRIAPIHRAQLLTYLLLCNLAHGKLVNTRTEEVEYVFVNTSLQHCDRVRFELKSVGWDLMIPGAANLRDLAVALMADWGTGLEVALYEEALVHLLGGPEKIDAEVSVLIDGRRIGTQRLHSLAPGVALKLTAFDSRLDRFEQHARRLLAHLDLRAIAWINLNIKTVTFTTLKK